MFMTDKDLKKAGGRATSARPAPKAAATGGGGAKPATKSTAASLSESVAFASSTAQTTSAILKTTSAKIGGGGPKANDSLLMASQTARLKRLEKEELDAKSLMLQKWYRGRRTSRAYFLKLKAITEKKLSDVETVTKLLEGKSAKGYIPPPNIALDLLLSVKVLGRGARKAALALNSKLVQYIAIPSFKSMEFIKMVCAQAKGAKSNPNPNGIDLLLWFLNKVLFEMLRNSVLKRSYMAVPSSSSSTSPSQPDSVPLKCFQLLQSACHQYRPFAAELMITSAAENINLIIKTIKSDIFAIFKSASDEVTSQMRLRDSFPSIREFTRFIHLKGNNFSNLIDSNILDNLLLDVINPQFQIASDPSKISSLSSSSSSSSNVDLLHQIMEMPVLMSLLTPSLISRFFNEFVLGCLGTGISSKNNTYISIIRRKYLDLPDKSVLDTSGITSAHWYCGNLISLFTVAALLPSAIVNSASSSSSSSSSLLQSKLALIDNQIQIYLATCNLFLRNLTFPGFFQGKSGVFIVKTNSIGSNSSLSSSSTAVAMPALLQAQLYSIYDDTSLKLLFHEYFSCINVQFSLPKGSEKDVKDISDSLKLGSGYRTISSILATEVKANSGIFGATGRWASKLLTSLSSPFSQSLSASDSLPTKQAATASSSTTISPSLASSFTSSASSSSLVPIPVSSRKEMNLAIASLLSDMWAIMLVPTGSDLSIASLPWQAASLITHSTPILSTFWIFFLTQSSQGINFGNDFNPITGFYPSSETAWLSVLVAILNIKLLTLDDEELFNSNEPLPLHQVLPLVRILNSVLFKIINEYPSLFEDGPIVVAAAGKTPSSSSSSSSSKSTGASSSDNSKKSGGGFFSFLSFYSSSPSSSSSSSSDAGKGTSAAASTKSMSLSLGLGLSSGGKVASAACPDVAAYFSWINPDDFHPANVRMFRYYFARSIQIVLSDFYTRWSRRPFSSPELWVLSEANSSSMIKSLTGAASSSGSGSGSGSSITAAGGGGGVVAVPLFRSVNECSNSEQRVALSSLRLMPWSISFVERMKLIRRHLDDEKVRIQGTNDMLQMHLGAFRSKGTIVKVRRAMIVEDGIRAFDKVAQDIKDRVVVQYVNEFGEIEAGVDAGGLFKDLLCDLSAKVFNPHYGLFCQTPSNLLYPNPIALRLFGASSDAEELYTFVGKILGKALFENITIQSEFSHFFLGFINGKYDFTHLLDDLKMLDPELHKNLLFLKSYEGDIRDLGLNFALSDNSLGTNNEIELIPGGGKIDVTSDNRHRYIHSVAKYYLHDRIKVQSKAFFRGLHQVIDPELLKMFCPPELQVLISGGLVAISVEEWRAYTSYGQGYVGAMDRTVQKFWTVVGELDERNLSLLLKFVTSCDRPPSLGFSQLEPRFTIHRADCDDPDNRLPTASTCFNILKLPTYSSTKVLKEKLLQAIQSGAGFDLS